MAVATWRDQTGRRIRFCHTVKERSIAGLGGKQSSGSRDHAPFGCADGSEPAASEGAAGSLCATIELSAKWRGALPPLAVVRLKSVVRSTV